MQVKILFFTKVKNPDASFRIAFALAGNQLPVVVLTKNFFHELSVKYPVKQHEEFDRHVNKNYPSRFLLEWEDELLPNEINCADSKIQLQWLSFPQVAKLLVSGKEKNFLQLAVQYISNGGIDESVIAADYDQDFIKTLQKKLEE